MRLDSPLTTMLHNAPPCVQPRTSRRWTGKTSELDFHNGKFTRNC